MNPQDLYVLVKRSWRLQCRGKSRVFDTFTFLLVFIACEVFSLDSRVSFLFEGIEGELNSGRPGAARFSQVLFAQQWMKLLVECALEAAQLITPSECAYCCILLNQTCTARGGSEEISFVRHQVAGSPQYDALGRCCMGNRVELPVLEQTQRPHFNSNRNRQLKHPASVPRARARPSSVAEACKIPRACCNIYSPVRKLTCTCDANDCQHKLPNEAALVVSK